MTSPENGNFIQWNGYTNSLINESLQFCFRKILESRLISPMQEMASTRILFGRLKMMIMVMVVVVVMMVMIMRPMMCFLGEVGHRQLGWLS